MPALHAFCQCHRLKITQTCRRYTRSVSATVSISYKHAGATRVLSGPPSQDHTNMPALHAFCQCHRLKIIQTCRRYTRSVSATVSISYKHDGATRVLSVPPSQDHTNMTAPHAFCQRHRLKIIQTCRRYTRSVSATVSISYKHAGTTRVLSVPPSQDHTNMTALHAFCQRHRLKIIQTCRRYTRSVSATVSISYKHDGATRVLSVPPSQDHTNMTAPHAFCQRHRLKIIQTCRRYTRSVSATVSRSYKRDGATRVLSGPPSQDHTNMPALHAFCQCHRLKIIQTCRRYTRSVSATVSRSCKHDGATRFLSVPPSQDHTNMPELHALCQRHRLNIIQT